MNIRTLAHLALVALAATLAGCGGGSESARAGAQEFASRIGADAPASDRLRAMAVRPEPAAAPNGTITNAQLFEWAQRTFPQYFGTQPPQAFTIVHEGKTFDVRAYTVGGQTNYAGVSQGENGVYGLGPYTGNALVRFGVVDDFSCTVVPALCQPIPGGTLNACGDLPGAALPTGTRTSLTYLYSGLINREQTVNTIIDGPETFEGQNAIRTTSTFNERVVTSVGPATTTTEIAATVRTYQQGTLEGLTRTFGSTTATVTTTTIAITGVPTTPPPTTVRLETKTVYNPATLNNEFTLSIGQTIDKVISETTTTLVSPEPTLPPPRASTRTYRHTFEARENLAVQGKTYDACRYRAVALDNNEVTTTWYLAGKGIPVKTQAVVSGGTQTIELKSGTYNGTPL